MIDTKHPEHYIDNINPKYFTESKSQTFDKQQKSQHLTGNTQHTKLTYLLQEDWDPHLQPCLITHRSSTCLPHGP